MNTRIASTDLDRQAADQSDASLLRAFAEHRSDAAFEQLVHRHCGLVIGVCRRVLRNSHDIEDVFQATFLVLARDVQRIRQQKSLPNWLYGVAYRLAMLAARQKIRRRETGNIEAEDVIGRDVLDDLQQLHNQQMMDEELNGLPERYRQPLVLHYLAGRSHQQVADELGLTVGAVDGLLKRGRKELRDRLARRGIAIGAALAAVHASQQVAGAAEVTSLVSTTTSAGIVFRSESFPAGAVSVRAAELAGKELATMSLASKAVLIAGITLGTGVLVGGFGLAITMAAPRPVALTPSPSPEIREIRVEPSWTPELNPIVAAPPATQQVAENGASDVKPTKYTNADEAYAIGAAFYNSRNFAASLEPFEAALKMAPDDKYRIKVYRALLGAYRQLPEIDKFAEAADFIITKSESAPERSLMRTDLMSFVHQRGKTDELAKKYESILAKDAKNVTALFVLSELYADLKLDPKRSAELLERLAKLTADSGAALNVPASAKLADQYVKQGKFQEGAALFEKIAPLDKNLAPWHWKEAAKAWIKAKDNARALAAAKAAVAAGPEKRGDLLLHFWHRALGQVFLEAGEPGLAVSHFEEALKTTTVEGYVKDVTKELSTAKERTTQQGK